MALISCPECGKEVSDRAVSCPNCGCPISSSIIPANSAISTVERSTRTTVRNYNFVSLIAAIVLIIGFNIPFLNTRNGSVLGEQRGNLGQWVSVLKQLNQPERGIEIIGESLGNERKSENRGSNLSMTVTVGTIMQVFLIIAIIVLIVNSFIRLKSGPIIIGVLGGIMLVLLTSNMTEVLKGYYRISTSAGWGCYVLALGLILSIFGDWDLQRVIIRPRNKNPEVDIVIESERKKQDDIETDLVNAVSLSAELELFFNENPDLMMELPPVEGRPFGLLAVYQDGHVEARFESDKSVIVTKIGKIFEDKPGFIGVNYRAQGAHHWLVEVMKKDEKLYFYIYLTTEDEKEAWRLNPSPEAHYSLKIQNRWRRNL